MAGDFYIKDKFNVKITFITWYQQCFSSFGCRVCETPLTIWCEFICSLLTFGHVYVSQHLQICEIFQDTILHPNRYMKGRSKPSIFRTNNSLCTTFLPICLFAIDTSIKMYIPCFKPEVTSHKNLIIIYNTCYQTNNSKELNLWEE